MLRDEIDQRYVLGYELGYILNPFVFGIFLIDLGRSRGGCRLLSSQIVVDKDEDQDADYDEKERDETSAESEKSRHVEKLTVDEQA